MSFQRIQQSTSQNQFSSRSRSKFSPRPFSRSKPQFSSPTQEEIENETFKQDKFEAIGLQLKEKDGTITCLEKERLGALQAKMDNLWTQRTEQNKTKPNLLEILLSNTETTPATPSAALAQPKLKIGQHDQEEQEADPVDQLASEHITGSTLDIQSHTDEKADTSSAQTVNTSAYTMNQSLVQIKQNSHNQIMRDAELPVQNTWQSLVAKGYEEQKKGNIELMESNFIHALKLIGESNVNLARNGHSDTTKLKPGLNLDVNFLEKPGRAGFLTKTGFDARLPLDGPYPDSAIIIGKLAFRSDTPVYTIMVVEHEKTHLTHQRNSVRLLQEWKKKADLKKFEKEYTKQKTQLEKFAKRSSMKPSDLETKLAEIKARLIQQWFKGQKRKDHLELELFYESIGTLKAAHFDSEVLSGLAGFMKGFHLIEIKNGVPTVDLFYELIDYPATKNYWKLNSKIVKDKYKEMLTNYYRNQLNESQRKAFAQQVLDYKKRFVSAKEYFQMLESIK